MITELLRDGILDAVSPRHRMKHNGRLLLLRHADIYAAPVALGPRE